MEPAATIEANHIGIAGRLCRFLYGRHGAGRPLVAAPKEEIKHGQQHANLAGCHHSLGRLIMPVLPG